MEPGSLRKNNGESRAAVNPAAHNDGTIVILNNGTADGQAQAGPFSDIFGGKERVVDLIKMLLRHASPGIGNLDLDTLLFGSR